MQQELTRWEYVTGCIAKWIVVQIACRVNRLAVLSMCLQVASLYHESIEVDE